MTVLMLLIATYDDAGGATTESWEIDEDIAADLRTRHGKPIADFLFPTMVDLPPDAVMVLH